MCVYWIFSTTLLFYVVPAVIFSMLLPDVSPRSRRQTDEGQNNNFSMTSVSTGMQSAPDAPQDVMTKEVQPDFTFAVWDSDGKICILAKLYATFTITYPSRGGEQAVSVNLPEDAHAKGVCGTSKENPRLQLSWPRLQNAKDDPFQFHLTMVFATIPSSDKSVPDVWVLQSMELSYNTGGLLFDGASNARRETARSQDQIPFFETSVGKSYSCPPANVIPLFNTKRDMVVIARLKEVHLQVYEVQKGKFAPWQRCNLVRIGGMEPFSQDQTVPVAVGSTLAVVAVLVVIGYALYRNMAVRKTDYNTME